MLAPDKKAKYQALGNILKGTRGRDRTVEDIAASLGVSLSFVYQVEQGAKKPKDAKIDQWASVYGVPHKQVWRAIDRYPPMWHATSAEQIGSEKELPELLDGLDDSERADVVRFVQFMVFKRTTTTP